VNRSHMMGVISKGSSISTVVIDPAIMPPGNQINTVAV
jgi:hypothetical protein